VEGLAEVLVRVAGAAAAAAHLVSVDVIKVGRVGGVVKVRHKRSLLQAQPLVKVHVPEVGVRLNFARVLAQPLLLSGAQLQNQVACLWGQLRLVWDVQRLLPVDHLKQHMFYCSTETRNLTKPVKKLGFIKCFQCLGKYVLQYYKKSLKG